MDPDELLLARKMAAQARSKGIEINEEQLQAAFNRFDDAEQALRKGKLEDLVLTGDALGSSDRAQSLLHHHGVAAGVMGRTTKVVADDIATYRQGIKTFKARVLQTDDDVVANVNAAIAALQRSTAAGRSSHEKDQATNEVGGQSGQGA